MTKKVYNNILNLCSSVFDDNEYQIVKNLLDNNRLNTLRLLVDEKIELLNVEKVIKPNNFVLDSQINMANELEDLILDAYLVSIDIN